MFLLSLHNLLTPPWTYFAVSMQLIKKTSRSKKTFHKFMTLAYSAIFVYLFHIVFGKEILLPA